MAVPVLVAAQVAIMTGPVTAVPATVRVALVPGMPAWLPRRLVVPTMAALARVLRVSPMDQVVAMTVSVLMMLMTATLMTTTTDK
jgi:hypothetical protein